MVRIVVVTALLLGACFEDRYVCETDADCDLGRAARCELDGFCTVFDPTCETERRYSEHSAEVANACFAGQVALANPCTGGQPAAAREGCAATVCEVLPACCDVGWSDACAQQAQLRCDEQCDTRLAITASRGSGTELWELTWDGTAWTPTQHDDRAGLLAWVGPAPGTIEPRLAGFTVDGAQLLVGELAVPAVVGRTYQAITTVDFDRSGRDTLALAYTEGGQHVQIIDLASGDTRDIFTDVGLRLAWGDSDRDAFPDGIAGRGGAYTLLRNIDGEGHERLIEATQSANMGGGATPANGTSSPQLRTLEWIDITGDGRLDLIAFGSQIRVHADEGALRDTPLLALDCDPLAAGCGMPRSTQTSYAGAVVPGPTGPALAVAMFTDPMLGLPRKLSTITIDPGPPARFTETPIADACPTCPAIIAVVARDLDGDHVLDIIGLDASLRLYTARSSTGGVLETDPFAGSARGPFTNVVTSVAGAPR